MMTKKSTRIRRTSDKKLVSCGPRTRWTQRGCTVEPPSTKRSPEALGSAYEMPPAYIPDWLTKTTGIQQTSTNSIKQQSQTNIDINKQNNLVISCPGGSMAIPNANRNPDFDKMSSSFEVLMSKLRAWRPAFTKRELTRWLCEKRSKQERPCRPSHVSQNASSSGRCWAALNHSLSDVLVLMSSPRTFPPAAGKTHARSSKALANRSIALTMH